jgi:GNAT superfamily N-acetyltransferase
MDPAIPAGTSTPSIAVAKTTARVVRVNSEDLTSADHDRIQNFISKYSFYDRATLDATLNLCSYVWLCMDPQGRIIGTTAVRRIELPTGVGGHASPATVVYTSVVAVNPAYRRLGLPARMGLKTYLLERLRAPFTPLYWLAEAVSPAGYLLMARNFPHFWPRPGQGVPQQAQDVIDATLVAAGVTIFDRRGDAHVVLEDYPVIELEQAPDRWDRSDPDVDFFLRTNPDYWAGAALVCLAPLNFFAVTRAVSSAAFKVLTRKQRPRFTS